MPLDLLPSRHGGAAENMVSDFLLLKRYPHSQHARYRHYGWQRPAFTFGYSQKIAFVRAQLPKEERVELCRRPTGGGVVDHRNDWTYSLVIPKGHALFDAPAPVSYKIIHEGIASSLAALGEPVELKTVCDTDAACEPGPTVCFTKPERYDVLRTDDGRKVAGAAQKRTRDGLLFQGSIARETVSASLDWDSFEERFIGSLATALALEAIPSPWPEWNQDEFDGLLEQYSSTEWNDFR